MKLKSILLVMLALCLTVCLCACGDDTTEKKDSKTTTTQSTEAEGTTTTEAATTTTTQPTNGEDTSNTEASTTAPSATEPTQPVDGKANYTVTVTDEAGNPIPGVFVQICLESCIPCITNAQGVASYPNMAVENYKVSFITIPEGYSCDKNEFYFGEDTYAMTIVLKAN